MRIVPTRPVRRAYHVEARRSADFAVLARDFSFESAESDARKLALAWMATLRRQGFDQIRGSLVITEDLDWLSFPPQPGRRQEPQEENTTS
jgi:hypothetical protein